MRGRSLLILLLLVLALVPMYYVNRWLQLVMRPRENAGRFFLFLFANFVLIIVYTVFLVGLVVRIFPVR
ncbi:MAG TPA: hypothetical protein VGQ51_18005 [Puia sp.]|jgi:hypothetical protein|nr:hypothetical protein [Puia sp.]